MTTWLVETCCLFDTSMVIKEYCCADVLSFRYDLGKLNYCTKHGTYSTILKKTYIAFSRVKWRKCNVCVQYVPQSRLKTIQAWEPVEGFRLPYRNWRQGGFLIHSTQFFFLSVHIKIGMASFVNLVSYPIFVYHCNFRTFSVLYPLKISPLSDYATPTLWFTWWNYWTVCMSDILYASTESCDMISYSRQSCWRRHTRSANIWTAS